MKDPACLHVVHILQHPPSRPTVKTTQDTMVYSLKKKHVPLPAGKYSKLTMHSKWRCHQVNEAKRALETERVCGSGALHSARSKKKLLPETRPETHFLSKEETEKWNEDWVDRETALPRKQVQDAELAIGQEQEDMRNTKKAGSTTRKPERSSQQMWNAIGDSLSDLRVQTQRRMWNSRKMMKKIQSFTS